MKLLSILYNLGKFSGYKKIDNNWTCEYYNYKLKNITLTEKTHKIEEKN